MRLSLQTDYALRVLMFLAQSDAITSVDQIAVAYGISRNHLMKVAARLADLGYVEAKRGRGGGLLLARDARAINVGTVVRELENTATFVECFEASSNQCPVSGACGLQGALSRALQDFMKRLDEYTLADLLPDPARFSRQLFRVV